jgi:predicted DCC family thiol-disulfide oxidoreductase YuxK
MQHNPEHIIFFDGVCSFCNFWVNFALKYNRKKNLFFAPLQSAYAKDYLAERNFNILDINTVVYAKQGKLYTQSSAVCYIAKQLRFPINLFFIFAIIPKFLRDAVYNIIARNRYKWFGKMDTCRVPSAAERIQFISAP